MYGQQRGGCTSTLTLAFISGFFTRGQGGQGVKLITRLLGDWKKLEHN